MFSSEIRNYAFDFDSYTIDSSLVIRADCFEWMKNAPGSLISAIVTDPPYGIIEYDKDQLEKRENGNGGIWRLPPSFDGHTRSPLPRFTALNSKQRNRLFSFFKEWGNLAEKILKPGGHIIIASNVFLSQLVFNAIVESGLEYRGQLIRLVKTLRGGDRPKNAEKEFPDVCTLPRGCFEPWGIFRKKFEGNVSDCLRQNGTGGIRRLPNGNPFFDVIESERTPKRESKLASHPSLKPQSFMRKVVYASLPLGKGIILDPFMGSGSTLAAANSLGLQSIGIERLDEYYQTSNLSIQNLSKIQIPICEVNKIS